MYPSVTTDERLPEMEVVTLHTFKISAEENKSAVSKVAPLIRSHIAEHGIRPPAATIRSWAKAAGIPVVVIAIRGIVYNVTDFAFMHPGGPEILFQYAGSDATSAFEGVNHSTRTVEYMKRYAVARLSEAETEKEGSPGVTEEAFALDNAKNKEDPPRDNNSNTSDEKTPSFFKRILQDEKPNDGDKPREDVVNSAFIVSNIAYEGFDQFPVAETPQKVITNNKISAISPPKSVGGKGSSERPSASLLELWSPQSNHGKYPEKLNSVTMTPMNQVPLADAWQISPASVSNSSQRSTQAFSPKNGEILQLKARTGTNSIDETLSLKTSVAGKEMSENIRNPVYESTNIQNDGIESEEVVDTEVLPLNNDNVNVAQILFDADADDGAILDVTEHAVLSTRSEDSSRNSSHDLPKIANVLAGWSPDATREISLSPSNNTEHLTFDKSSVYQPKEILFDPRRTSERRKNEGLTKDSFLLKTSKKEMEVSNVYPKNRAPVDESLFGITFGNITNLTNELNGTHDKTNYSLAENSLKFDDNYMRSTVKYELPDVRFPSGNTSYSNTNEEAFVIVSEKEEIRLTHGHPDEEPSEKPIPSDVLKSSISQTDTDLSKMLPTHPVKMLNQSQVQEENATSKLKAAVDQMPNQNSRAFTRINDSKRLEDSSIPINQTLDYSSPAMAAIFKVLNESKVGNTIMEVTSSDQTNSEKELKTQDQVSVVKPTIITTSFMNNAEGAPNDSVENSLFVKEVTNLAVETHINTIPEDNDSPQYNELEEDEDYLKQDNLSIVEVIDLESSRISSTKDGFGIQSTTTSSVKVIRHSAHQPHINEDKETSLFVNQNMENKPTLTEQPVIVEEPSQDISHVDISRITRASLIGLIQAAVSQGLSRGSTLIEKDTESREEIELDYSLNGVRAEAVPLDSVDKNVERNIEPENLSLTTGYNLARTEEPLPAASTKQANVSDVSVRASVFENAVDDLRKQISSMQARIDSQEKKLMEQKDSSNLEIPIIEETYANENLDAVGEDLSQFLDHYAAAGDTNSHYDHFNGRSQNQSISKDNHTVEKSNLAALPIPSITKQQNDELLNDEFTESLAASFMAGYSRQVKVLQQSTQLHQEEKVKIQIIDSKSLTPVKPWDKDPLMSNPAPPLWQAPQTPKIVGNIAEQRMEFSSPRRNKPNLNEDKQMLQTPNQIPSAGGYMTQPAPVRNVTKMNTYEHLRTYPPTSEVNFAAVSQGIPSGPIHRTPLPTRVGSPLPYLGSSMQLEQKVSDESPLVLNELQYTAKMPSGLKSSELTQTVVTQTTTSTVSKDNATQRPLAEYKLASNPDVAPSPGAAHPGLLANHLRALADLLTGTQSAPQTVVNVQAPKQAFISTGAANETTNGSVTEIPSSPSLSNISALGTPVHRYLPPKIRSALPASSPLYYASKEHPLRTLEEEIQRRVQMRMKTELKLRERQTQKSMKTSANERGFVDITDEEVSASESENDLSTLNLSVLSEHYRQSASDKTINLLRESASMVQNVQYGKRITNIPKLSSQKSKVEKYTELNSQSNHSSTLPILSEDSKQNSRNQSVILNGIKIAKVEEHTLGAPSVLNDDSKNLDYTNSELKNEANPSEIKSEAVGTQALLHSEEQSSDNEASKSQDLSTPLGSPVKENSRSSEQIPKFDSPNTVPAKNVSNWFSHLSPASPNQKNQVGSLNSPDKAPERRKYKPRTPQSSPPAVRTELSPHRHPLEVPKSSQEPLVVGADTVVLQLKSPGKSTAVGSPPSRSTFGSNVQQQTPFTQNVSEQKWKHDAYASHVSRASNVQHLGSWDPYGQSQYPGSLTTVQEIQMDRISRSQLERAQNASSMHYPPVTVNHPNQIHIYHRAPPPPSYATPGVPHHPSLARPSMPIHQIPQPAFTPRPIAAVYMTPQQQQQQQQQKQYDYNNARKQIAPPLSLPSSAFAAPQPMEETLVQALARGYNTALNESISSRYQGQNDASWMKSELEVTAQDLSQSLLEGSFYHTAATNQHHYSGIPQGYYVQAHTPTPTTGRNALSLETGRKFRLAPAEAMTPRAALAAAGFPPSVALPAPVATIAPIATMATRATMSTPYPNQH